MASNSVLVPTALRLNPYVSGIPSQVICSSLPAPHVMAGMWSVDWLAQKLPLLAVHSTIDARYRKNPVLTINLRNVLKEQ
ncbi:hypothetical protein XELAEV_18009853mg [Xenopus laevis]|uniref:Uncharacterized protein n=1 Tax=Xenopus laevis TaxID=8355 RepID=A0A974I0T4_XENLA|nr:hypothetical protein XELAEV_18009853mg [Xenopus laevis]